MNHSSLRVYKATETDNIQNLGGLELELGVRQALFHTHSVRPVCIVVSFSKVSSFRPFEFVSLLPE